MRNIDIVELLLDKGAKVSAVDKVSCYHHVKYIGLDVHSILYVYKSEFM